MARAKSPEKRQAILQAAVREIARSGLGASTAKIAKGANLAEGTLFTYFPTKHELLNGLYLELKTGVHRRIDAGFPHADSLRERTRHVWIQTMRWAIEQPDERKVSLQLNVSDIVTDITRQRAGSESGAVARAMREIATRGAFQGLPSSFAPSVMGAMQDAVLDTIAKNARGKTALIEKGFEAFWRMAR